MNTRTDDAIKIAEQIIDSIIEEKYESITSVVRLYYTLVTTIGDEEEIRWTENELYGYDSISDVPAYRMVRYSDTCCYVTHNSRILTDNVNAELVLAYPKYQIIGNEIRQIPGHGKNKKSQFQVGPYTFFHIIRGINDRLFEQTNIILNDLKFGDIVEDIFTSQKDIVDKKLMDIAPSSIKKFNSSYENLQSGNEEDWANAVHSCRRILKDVADTLYPPSDEPFVTENGQKRKIGNEQYINRLMLYIEDRSSSDTFTSVVGTNLDYIAHRIDAIHDAANKGTHDKVELEEAKRYIIYTYLLLGDILSL